MPNDNLENIKIHKRLIAAMVNKLLSEGYEVSASYIGYPNGCPDEFNKYTPDIYAEKNGKKLIIEADTCSSLNNKETQLRWTALSMVDNVNFSVIVQASCVFKAKSLAKKWKIEIKDYWKMKT